MSNYTDLDLDHKREFLVNIKALFLATFNLAQVIEDADFTDIANELWVQAFNQVSSLSDEEVERSIKALQQKHKDFNSQGEIIVETFKRENPK